MNHQRRRNYIRRRPLVLCTALALIVCPQESLFSADAFSLSKSRSPATLSMVKTDTEKGPFELHVGRAIDTLQKDYPRILMETPDFSIYDPEIEFVDPSGVKVTGLRKYKAAFGLIHGFIQFVYV